MGDDAFGLEVVRELQHRLLAFQLGLPVGVERVRIILLNVGAAFGAIEHIISGVMYDPRAQLLRFRS